MTLDRSILGVDVNRQWQQYDGDLALIDDVDNVYQALFNRLTCRYGDMAYFYSDYGSKLYDWLCTPSYQQNIDLLAEEVRIRVMEEPRVSKADVLINKINPYLLEILVNCTIDENDSFSGNFVLNTRTNELNMRGGEPTYLTLSLGRWNCPLTLITQKEIRVGESLRILCKVTNRYDEGIPIGCVDFYMGVHHIGTIDLVKGYADWTYTIPTNTPIGTYEITAHYRGIGRFASSIGTVTIKVVNKYTTITRYINNPNYGVAGEQICLPTSVKDINGGNVTGGEVYHYLNISRLYKLGTKLTISDMYKIAGDTSCVFQDATLIDGWGDPVQCGLVNFYINNGLGVLRATKTIIDNTYTTEKDPQYGCYYSKVVDETGANVWYGDFAWYLRKYHGGLQTSTLLPKETSMYKGFNDCIFAEVKDEDGLPVTDGEFEYYLKCLKMCQPYFSKTDLDYAFNIENNMNTFLSALVTDTNDFIVDDGGLVDFSFDDIPQNLTEDEKVNLAFDLTRLPVLFEANNGITNPNMRAMIVDSDDVIIDRGELITEETINGTVTSYVSNPDVDEDLDTIELKIKGNDIDG